MNRSQFINAASSEKLTLAIIKANKRVINFELESGTIYSKTVPFFVQSVKTVDTLLTKANSAAIVTGEFYYDSLEGKLYVDVGADTVDFEIIVTYKLHFSNNSITLPHDLLYTSPDVHFDGRIVGSPKFQSKVGINQDLVSTVGSGNLEIENSDGFLDDIYDDLIFENQEILIYSHNRFTPVSDAKLLFRGLISDKSFDSSKVVFNVKDDLFNLLGKVPQGVFTQEDGVNETSEGRTKRWVYGRVDGLKLQSLDQIGDGYSGAGLITSTPQKMGRFTIESSFFGSQILAPSDDLNDEFFKVYSPEVSYFCYINVAGGATVPVPADFTGVSIPIASGLTGATKITTLFGSIKTALTPYFTVLSNPSSSVAYFENKTVGSAAVPDTSSISELTSNNLGLEIVGSYDTTVSGVGTSFISSLASGDTIFAASQELTVSRVVSDTLLELDDAPEGGFSSVPYVISPERGVTIKNREFFVAEHACAQVETTVVNPRQLNRIQVSSTSGFSPGDLLTINGESVQVKNIAPNNIIVLQQNIINLPSSGDIVTRQPIQNVYIDGYKVNRSDFTINNAVGECSITLSSDAEKNITRPRSSSSDLVFTNGSRFITGTINTDLLLNRDFIKPNNTAYSTYYQVLNVDSDGIELVSPFSEATVTDRGLYLSPNYIDDDTIVSCDVLGKTENGETDGTWIKTTAQVTIDLLNEVGVSSRINTESFNYTESLNNQLVSIALPLSPDSDTLSVKEVIDLMGRTTNTSLSLDNDLNIIYKSMTANAPTNPVIIGDSDVISWSVTSKSGKLYNYSVMNYRFSDVKNSTLESGSKTFRKISKFVTNYVGTEKTIERDIYLYDEFDANIAAERVLYYNALSLTEIKVFTDLRLEGLSIGDVVQLEFARLYKRFGGEGRKKLAIVVGRSVTGNRIELTLTDLGNTFNTSAFVTPNDALDFDLASEDDKLKHGYITDANGVVNNDDASAQTNKIS